MISMAFSAQSFEEERIYNLVLELLGANTRDAALLELSKKREQYEDLALVLWYSFGEHCSTTPRLSCLAPLLTPVLPAISLAFILPLDK